MALPIASIINTEARRPDDGKLAGWRRVVSHTHHLRSGELDLETTNANLLRWCRAHRIEAIGVGSPWEPASKAAYQRCEGPDRDRYYAGLIDPESVKHETEVRGLIDDLNDAAGGATSCYLDNETPKCRYGHLWWFGWDFDFPPWHDYSQDRPICYHEGDPERELNPLTGEPHRRRPYLEIVAAQRRSGALGIWAHPTSWWLEGERFVTNIAAECHLHLLCDGYLDGLVTMGYDPFHRGYQGLWCHLLDTGAVVPGFAETDNCHNQAALLDQPRTHANRMELPPGAPLSAIIDRARAGCSVATTGALLTLAVDGAAMGSIVETASDATHVVTIGAYGDGEFDAFSRIELVGLGGRVLATIEDFAGGEIELALPGSAAHGYVYVRSFGPGDKPGANSQQAVRHHAVTNPVYLHPRGFRFAPAMTALELTVAETSPWIGGELRLEDAAGACLERGSVRVGTTSVDLPAGARVTLERDGRSSTRYLAMHNRAVQEQLAILWQGRFREHQPQLSPGEVPPATWDLTAMRQALAQCRLEA